MPGKLIPSCCAGFVLLMATAGWPLNSSAQDVDVSYGNQAQNSVATTYSNLTVASWAWLYDQNPIGVRYSRYDVNAPLTVVNQAVALSSGILAVNANLTAGSVVVSPVGQTPDIPNAPRGARLVQVAGTITTGLLEVGTPAGYLRTGGRYATTNLSLYNGGAASYTAADSVSASGTVSLGGGSGGPGVLSLERNLVAKRFEISGGGFFRRTSATYTVSDVGVSQGGTLDYRAGDAITNSALIGSDGALALYAPLVLKQLRLGGARSTVTHMPGGSIQAQGFIVSGGSLTILPGDSFHTGTTTYGATVYGAGTVTQKTPEAFTTLGVSEDSTYNVEAPLTVDNQNWSPLQVFDTKTQFNVRDTVTMRHGLEVGSSRYRAGGTVNMLTPSAVLSATSSSVRVSENGRINLIAGKIVAGALILDGTGAISRTGGSYTVGSLYLNNGASLDWRPGDSVSAIMIGGLNVTSNSGTFRLPATESVSLTLSTLGVGVLRPARSNWNDHRGGLFDVGMGQVTVTSGLSATDVRAAIIAGLGDGTWSGTVGITSSAAARDLAASVPRTVGWLDNYDGSVTFAYAAPGDTNLDRLVDVVDAANFLAAGKYDNNLPATWSEGDFSYDGVVDILDAADLVSTGLFNAGYYDTSPGIAGSTVAVPEPTALPVAAIGIGLFALARRRK